MALKIVTVPHNTPEARLLQKSVLQGVAEAIRYADSYNTKSREGFYRTRKGPKGIEE